MMSQIFSITVLTATLAGCMMIESVQLNTHWGDTRIETAISCDVYIPLKPSPMPKIPTPDPSVLQDVKLKQKFLLDLVRAHREFITSEQERNTAHYAAHVEKCR